MTPYPFSATLDNNPREDKPIDPRDMEILVHLSDGKTIKEIACLVHLSLAGVKYRLIELRSDVLAINNTQLVYLHRRDIEKVKSNQTASDKAA